MRFLRPALLCLCIATPVSAETLYGLRTYTAEANEAANFLVTVDTESRQTGIVGPLGLEDYRYISIGVAGTRGRSLTGVLWDFYADTASIVDIDPTSGQSTIVRDIRSKKDFGYEGMRGLAATKKGQLFSSVDGRRGSHQPRNRARAARPRDHDRYRSDRDQRPLVREWTTVRLERLRRLRDRPEDGRGDRNRPVHCSGTSAASLTPRKVCTECRIKASCSTCATATPGPLPRHRGGQPDRAARRQVGVIGCIPCARACANPCRRPYAGRRRRRAVRCGTSPQESDRFGMRLAGRRNSA